VSTSLYQKLALLTDAEAEQCLNGVLKGLMVAQPEYADLLSAPDQMAQVVQAAAADAGQAALQIGEVTSPERPKAIRAILAELAEDPALNPRLEAWLNTARPTLLDPVTSALVLAGIIMVLSTHIRVEYEDKGGKKHLRVKVEKKPTADKIMTKFFGFFQ